MLNPDPLPAPADAPPSAMGSRLILDIRRGDTLLIDGVRIEFQQSTRMVVRDRGRFVFGKQYMPPDAATSPLRRLYYLLQQAYAGPCEERRDATSELAHQLQSHPDLNHLEIMRHLTADNPYKALAQLRRRIRDEEIAVVAHA